jgi:hypothetical protein
MARLVRASWRGRLGLALLLLVVSGGAARAISYLLAPLMPIAMGAAVLLAIYALLFRRRY